MILDLYCGIKDLCVLRDARNAPRSAVAPPVLPSQLLQRSPREFFSLVRTQRERLLVTKSEQDIEYLEQEFIEFRRSYLHGDYSGSALASSSNGGCVFERAWDKVGPRFSKVREFAGGLATVFPGTATVEADFSAINREANDARSCLLDLSLERILRARQWHLLRQL